LAEKKRLVIVPDKELCYLPFEALVADLQAGRYLIQAYSISYAYSGKLLRHSAEVQPKDGKVSILAMAPFAYGMGMKKTALRDEITEPPLYASGDEVTQIGGQVYKDQDATKERFLQQANGYDIVHLATHAKANNTDPLHSFVAFHRQQAPSGSSYRLYAQELYNLRLEKLKLVVLSGCETGGGKLVQGEGIMSLARAFAYAGCPSIVTTLWRAEDRTTAAIATRFHHHLKAGEPKDEALRLAKLDYLDSQKHYRLRSPVYWANFIFIGDTVPVYNTSSIYWWWASGAVLMGVFIFLGVRFYRRRPSRAGLSAKLR
jgi:CHAT domain-containing protein